jgi:hypothetical protein
LASSNPVTNKRQDPTSAYKCVELDPDTVAADGNIHIDLETGAIDSLTLKGILEERKILKDLVNPDKNTNEETRTVAAFLLAAFIILFTGFCGWYFIFSKDTNTVRKTGEIVSTVIISLLLIIGTGIATLGNSNIKTAGGITVGVGVLLGLLFYLIYFVAYPPPVSECAKTTNKLLGVPTGNSPNLAGGPSAIRMPSWFTLSPIRVTVLCVVFAGVGFITGMLL